MFAITVDVLPKPEMEVRGSTSTIRVCERYNIKLVDHCPRPLYVVLTLTLKLIVVAIVRVRQVVASIVRACA